MNNRIRLTESQLHKVITESVKRVLSESAHVLAKSVKVNGYIFPKGENEQDVKERLHKIFGDKYKAYFKAYFMDNNVWNSRKDRFDDPQKKSQTRRYTIDELEIPIGDEIVYRSSNGYEIPFTYIGDGKIQGDDGEVYTLKDALYKFRGKDLGREITKGYHPIEHFAYKGENLYRRKKRMFPTESNEEDKI